MKKIFFLSLMSLLVFSGCTKKSDDTNRYVDKLPDKVEQGIILHAFGWSFKQIREYLPSIKDSGYKAVQTMPVQQPKSGGASWMFFYQPVSFNIATTSPLGSKQDLKDLCDAAEGYGIDIIVDVVFNHMATDGTYDSMGLPTVDAEVNTYEPYIYQHQDVCFHHVKNITGPGAVTQVYAYGGGLPDLNTGNSYIQEKAAGFLKECIDVGVDGFRFDAAKHIETPQDSEYASEFWPNTLGVAQEYYKQKNNGKELYAYGEILDDVDGGRELSTYTDLMHITDNGYVGAGVSNAVLLSQHKASLAVEAQYGKNSSPINLVTWAESHDTFASESSHSGMKKVMRVWAIIASRKNTTSLFFARPDEDSFNFIMGNVATTYFEDEHVGTVNRFHNRFIGAEEYQSAQNEKFYVNERYSDTDAGAIVVDLALAGQTNITFSHLPDGSYYDQVTSREVKVSEGKADITFDGVGIAVLTKTNNKIRPTIDVDKKSQKYYAPFNVKVKIDNATNCTYQLDNGSEVAFTDNASIRIGEGKNPGDVTKLTIKFTNGEYESSRIYEYEKVYVIEGSFNIIGLKESYLTDYELYIWSWTNTSKYSQDYTWNDEHKILLINNADRYTGFLLVLFNKGHVPAKMDTWESPLKQTSDINPKDGFYDAINF